MGEVINYPQNEIKKIYQNKLMKDNLFGAVTFSLIVIFYSSVFYFRNQEPEILIFILMVIVLVLLWGLLFIFISGLKIEPLILYENGIKIHQEKLKIALGKKREFINFNNIAKIDIKIKIAK